MQQINNRAEFAGPKDAASQLERFKLQPRDTGNVADVPMPNIVLTLFPALGQLHGHQEKPESDATGSTASGDFGAAGAIYA